MKNQLQMLSFFCYICYKRLWWSIFVDWSIEKNFLNVALLDILK